MLECLSVEIVEVDTVTDNIYLSMFMLRDGIAVGLRDDSKAVEDATGIELSRAQHLELIMKEEIGQASMIQHSTFYIHREGILKVKYLWQRRMSDILHGTNHLCIDDVRLHLGLEVAVAATSTAVIPEANLQRADTEQIANNTKTSYYLRKPCNANILAVFAHLLKGRLVDLAMRECKEIDLVVLSEGTDLIISPKFVALLEGIWKPW